MYQRLDARRINRSSKMADEDTQPCGVCSKPCGSAHKCLKCKKPVHVLCGIESEEEEGYGQSVLCFKYDTKGKMGYSILYIIIHFCELILNDMSKIAKIAFRENFMSVFTT